MTVSRLYLFYSICRGSGPAVHLAICRLMQPAIGLDFWLDLSTGRQGRQLDCLGLWPYAAAAGAANRRCAVSGDLAAAPRPLFLADIPDVFAIGRHAFWASAGPGSLA